MRYILASASILLAACGGTTDTGPTRYNFGIIDGANQSAAAGTSDLSKPVRTQLTRDPQGEFAWVDLILPKKAYAQAVSLPGEPMVGAIVCGRVAPVGEPQVVPLCAFTDAGGKAVNTVRGGTKAGTYTILFTAQVQASEPVEDSTTVTVEPGAPDANYQGFLSPYMSSPALVPVESVQDIYQNPVPFRVVADERIKVSGGTAGTDEARTVVFDASLADNIARDLEMRDVDDRVVGHLTYRINIGPNGAARINFQARGS